MNTFVKLTIKHWFMGKIDVLICKLKKYFYFLLYTKSILDLFMSKLVFVSSLMFLFLCSCAFAYIANTCSSTATFCGTSSNAALSC